MTSNIGSHIIQEAFEKVTEKNIEEIKTKTKTEVFQLLKETVRPEFLNRVDEIVMFNPLLKNDIKGIIKIQLTHLSNTLLKTGINIEFTDYALDFLAENSYDIVFGARPLKRLIQKEIINPLSKKILAGEVDKNKTIVVDVFDNLVVFRS